MKYLLHIVAGAVFFLFTSELSALTLSKDATFYSDSFEGGNTSNNEIFHQDGFTAAVCDIALGKNIYVSSENTGTLIHINDRPNCNRYPNILDLTRTAFTLFAPASVGRIPSLQIDTLDSIDSHIFTSLGVELDSGTPSVYFAGDGIEINGRVLDKKKKVIVYLKNSTTLEEDSPSYLFSTSKNGTFSAHFMLPGNPGKYILIIASGVGFKTKTSATINLVDRSTYINPPIAASDIQLSASIDSSSSTPSISYGHNFWGDILMHQDTRSFHTSGSRFIFDTLPFYPGQADIRITGYTFGVGGSLDRRFFLDTVYSGSIMLDRTHEKTGQNLVSLRSNRSATTLKFRVPATPRIRATYYLTLPSGDVRELDFPKEYVGSNGFLLPGKIIVLSLPTSEKGTYLVESVQEDGIAYFNLPIVRGQVWNILKPYSSSSTHSFTGDSTAVESYVVNHVNKIRAKLGRGLLVIDPEFSRLAQAKADDMLKRNYFGHKDPDEKYIGTLAEKIGVNIEGEFRENIAYGEGDIGHIVLQDGLEESGSHRYAMIVPSYTKIGIGYVHSGKKVFIVHILGQ